MITSVLLFAVGLVLLIKGGDWFVDGATGIAKRFNLPDIVVGATVVSIGKEKNRHEHFGDSPSQFFYFTDVDTSKNTKERHEKNLYNSNGKCQVS